MNRRLVAVFLFGFIGSFFATQQIFAATLQAQQRPAGLMNGLLGYWSFNGTDVTDKVYDRSGQGDNGYFINGATSSAKVRGVLGQGIKFDGIDDYVAIPQNGHFNLSGSAFAISLWVLDNSNITSNYHRLVSWYDGTNSFQLGLYGRQFYIQNDPSAGTAAKQHTSAAASGWNHVVATFDGGSTYHMYLNGILSDSAGGASPFNFLGNTTILYVGQRGDNAGFANGPIDDVRIYNRALSAEEVKQLYRLGQVTVKPPNRSNLAAWYKLDENGSIFADSSGNGGTGSFTGSVGRGAGRIGRAFTFPGTPTSRADVSGGSQPGYPFSISLWFRANVLSGALVSYGAGNTTIALTGSYLHLAGGGDSYHYGTPLTNFTTGKWYHVVATYASQSAKTLYVNGVDKTTATDDYWDACGFQIGERDTCGGNPLSFNGAIDDVRVYSKVLSPAEVLDIYRQAPPIVGNSQPSLVPQGLVGYWSFNGPDLTTTTAYDRSGQGNNGTLTNSPVPAQGKIGQALDFDGSNDYITVPAISSLNTMSAISVSAWIRPDSNGQSNSGRIIDKGWRITPGWDFRFTSSYSYALIFDVDFDGTDLVLNTVSNSLTPLVWQHVVVSWDGSTSISNAHIYINGVEASYAVTQSAAGNRVNDSANPLIIGNGYNDYVRTWDGKLDELRIYNRALTAAEVKLLYNAGK